MSSFQNPGWWLVRELYVQHTYIVDYHSQLREALQPTSWFDTKIAIECYIIIISIIYIEIPLDPHEFPINSQDIPLISLLKSHDFNRISPLAFQPFPGIGSQEALDGLGHGRFGRRLPEAGRTGPGFCVENAMGKDGESPSEKDLLSSLEGKYWRLTKSIYLCSIFMVLILFIYIFCFVSYVFFYFHYLSLSEGNNRNNE